ncbi:MAG: hypothetical protein IJF24_01745 [Clostridia bacterium]|nr:hypothetical protein [Clostridia bacterium]
MLLLKRFSRVSAHPKFQTFRRAHAVFSLIYFLFFLLGVVLCSARLMTLEGIEAAEDFELHWQTRIAQGELPFSLYGFCSVLPQVLGVMIFGITIYAPLFCGLSAGFSALVLGFYVRMLLGLLSRSGAYFPLVYYVLGALPLVLVQLLLFSFSAAVSLRIFTPHREGDREDELLFGGTLFCAPYYKNVINFRFLLTYLAIFVLGVILIFLCCLLQAAMVLKL